jgi:hypothetical protein
MKSISVRIPDDLHARVKTASESDRRSLNAEILWLIERGLEQTEGGSG